MNLCCYVKQYYRDIFVHIMIYNGERMRDLSFLQSRLPTRIMTSPRRTEKNVATQTGLVNAGDRTRDLNKISPCHYVKHKTVCIQCPKFELRHFSGDPSHIISPLLWHLQACLSNTIYVIHLLPPRRQLSSLPVFCHSEFCLK